MIEVPEVEASIRMEHQDDCCCRYVLVPPGQYETKLIDTRCIAAYLVPSRSEVPGSNVEAPTKGETMPDIGDGPFTVHPGAMLPADDEDKEQPTAWLPRGLVEGSLGDVVRRSLAEAAHATEDKAFDALVQGVMAYLSDYMHVVRTDANQNTAAKLNAEGPRLGLATAREMLQELQTRAQVGGIFQRDDSVDYAHDRLDRITSRMLATLPAEVLDYRTVYPQ